jgi:hypothetical protein
VKANLDWDMVSRIEVNLPDLPGASIEVCAKRATAPAAPPPSRRDGNTRIPSRVYGRRPPPGAAP